MNEEAFASYSPPSPVALIDLVETKTPEANRAFIARIGSALDRFQSI
jgi:hypothetical protein